MIFPYCRRRSKSHRSSLHSYCVSGGGRGGQLYDDLYLAGHLPRLSNTYTTSNTFYNRNQVSTKERRKKSLVCLCEAVKLCENLQLFVPQSPVPVSIVLRDS